MNVKHTFDARTFAKRDFDVQHALDVAMTDPYCKLRSLCIDYEENKNRTDRERQILESMILQEKQLLISLGYKVEDFS